MSTISMGSHVVEADGLTEKLIECAPGIVGLASGDGAKARRLLATVVGPPVTTLGVPRDIRAMGARLAEEHVRLRLTEVEATIFGTRGMKRADFYAGIAAGMGASLASPIDAAAQAHNLNAEVLLVGADDYGAHLQWVGHPGMAFDWNVAAHAVLGNGYLLGRLVLEDLKHVAATPLATTVVQVYVARRRAAEHPGVGSDGTDMAIIEGTSTKRLTTTDIEELEKLYQSLRVANGDAISTSATKLSFLTTKKV